MIDFLWMLWEVVTVPTKWLWHRRLWGRVALFFVALAIVGVAARVTHHPLPFVHYVDVRGNFLCPPQCNGQYEATVYNEKGATVALQCRVSMYVGVGTDSFEIPGLANHQHVTVTGVLYASTDTTLTVSQNEPLKVVCSFNDVS